MRSTFVLMQRNKMYTGNITSREYDKLMTEHSESLKGIPKSPETRQAMSDAMKGRSAHNKGVPQSPERRQKQSDAMKGRSAHNKGVPQSPEQRQKISNSQKESWRLRKIALAFALLTATTLSHAEVFRCELNGKPVFQDKPCAGQTTQKAVVAPAREGVNEIQPYVGRQDEAQRLQEAIRQNDEGMKEAMRLQEYDRQNTVLVTPSYSTEEQAEMVKTAIRVVKENLIDPDSATFKDIRVYMQRVQRTREDSTTICGLVNANNKMGGKTGFKAFSFTLGNDKPVVLLEDETLGIKTHGRIQATCEEKGVLLEVQQPKS